MPNHYILNPNRPGNKCYAKCIPMIITDLHTTNFNFIKISAQK